MVGTLLTSSVFVSGRRWGLGHLAGDPPVRQGEASFQGDGWLPAEGPPQVAMVTAPAPYSLRPARIVPLPDLLAGDAGDDVGQLVDGDQAAIAGQALRYR